MVFEVGLGGDCFLAFGLCLFSYVEAYHMCSLFGVFKKKIRVVCCLSLYVQSWTSASVR